MSKEALAKVVQRAISDGAFRRQLSSDPGTALRGFDLSADETAAIRSGDSGRLSSLGVDLRMSKAFTISSDQATGAAHSPALSSDLGASYTGAITTADPGSAGSSALTSGDIGDNDALITSGDNAGHDSVVIAGEPAHAFGAQTTGDNSGTFGNVLTSGDDSTDGVLVVDEGGGPSGASTPGEASHGPSIQE
jgi:hypothetical protein